MLGLEALHFGLIDRKELGCFEKLQKPAQDGHETKEQKTVMRFHYRLETLKNSFEELAQSNEKEAYPEDQRHRRVPQQNTRRLGELPQQAAAEILASGCRHFPDLL